jgi:hypothetical protein
VRRREWFLPHVQAGPRKRLPFIVQARELEGFWADVGRVGPLCFSDMRASDEWQANSGSIFWVMRPSDKQEVLREKNPSAG